MTANMYAWEPALPLDPHAPDFPEKVEAYCDPARQSRPSAAMRAFVGALLARYPDLSNGDEDTPWADGPLIGDASGGFINVSIIWSRYEEAASFFIHTANGLGLHAYDPQSSTFFPAKAHAKSADRRSRASWALWSLALAGIAAASPDAVSRRDVLTGRLSKGRP